MGRTPRLTNKTEWKASPTWEGPDVWKTRPQTTPLHPPPQQRPCKVTDCKGPWTSMPNGKTFYKVSL